MRNDPFDPGIVFSERYYRASETNPDLAPYGWQKWAIDNDIEDDDNFSELSYDEGDDE